MANINAIDVVISAFMMDLRVDFIFIPQYYPVEKRSHFNCPGECLSCADDPGRESRRPPSTYHTRPRHDVGIGGRVPTRGLRGVR